LNQRSFPKTRIARRAATVFVLVLVVCCASHTLRGQTQSKNCKGPANLERKVATHPSASAYGELGAYFGQADRYTCAVSAFRSSLRLNSKSWQTRSYLGLALLASGKPEEAARELRTSLSLNPNQPSTHMTLGATLSQLNQLDAAIEQFNVVLKVDPKSVTALDWLSKALISQKRYSAAIVALKKGPPDEVLQMNLVIAYSKSGENDEAIRLLSQMIRDRPSSAVPHAGLATIYIQQNRLEEAVVEFREALRLDQRDDASRISYVKVLVSLPDFETALPIAKDYLQRHPNEFEARYLMGWIDRELGNYDEAREMLTQAVRLIPGHFDAHYSLGVVFAKLGEPALAREQLEKALQIDSLSDQAHFRLAAVLRSLGLQDEAKKQFELYQVMSAERGKKDVATNKANQAKEFFQKGEIQKAVDLYKEAVQENPEDARMLLNLALALDQKGDYQSEGEAIEKAIAIDPDFALAHNQLGLVHLQTGQVREATKEFRTAISLDPHYAEAQNNMGTVYGQQGDDAEAERLFRQAIESNPGYAQAFVNLAATLASQSRFTEAEAALQSAVQIEPDNKEAHELHAMIQAQSNQQSPVAK
jgi:tetratricopeptide (TPR) repeat protein